MVMTDETDHSGGVILDGPFDPDAQATVTDYIDYTEYLPADLIRSLTLIRGLDDRFIDSAQTVHDLAKTYGQLLDIPSDERPSPVVLRKDISHNLDRAINAREASYAEACRLYDVVDRHFDRLTCIRQKLDALPKPPSREPSPVPEPTPKRARTGKKQTATTRIKLRVDDRKRIPKSRSRRLDLSGIHPDSPLASTEVSDAEDLDVLPPKPARPPKKDKARRPSAGTVASTSNALALLKPPPEDAKIGSVDLPWLRLTEWEMTKLRKKMKKNAVWQPSEVMIHRELSLSGRGWDAYRTSKALADETGAEFVDCDDIENTRRGEMAREIEETKLSNRGMKLNEAKKLKREMLAREAAANGGAAAAKPLPSPAQATPNNRSSRKRKRDEATAADETTSAGLASAPATVATSKAQTTRRRSSRGTAVTGDAIGAAITYETSPMAEPKAEPRPTSPLGVRHSTRAAAQPTTTSTPPASRPSSRRSAAAALIDQGGLGSIPTTATAGSRDLRIKSATPARKTPVREPSHAPSVPGPTRKRKRPAPGPVSNGEDGGAAVSFGRRKAKPGKKRTSIQSSQGLRVDEDGVLEQIDANEPRYCICGDVSFGTMICCENPDCDREWFHLDCVGLSEVPSRTAKWYCPNCRVKFHKGPDGIVKGGSRR